MGGEEAAVEAGLRSVEAGAQKVSCGCWFNPVTSEIRRCERHRAMREEALETPKGAALAALDRAWSMAMQAGDGISILELVTLRGYLEFARKQVDRIQELKRARPAAASARGGKEDGDADHRA